MGWFEDQGYTSPPAVGAGVVAGGDAAASGGGGELLEGRSITRDQYAQQIQAAIAAGVPEAYAADYLARNPGDSNRLIESYKSERGGGATAAPTAESRYGSTAESSGAPAAIQPYDKTFTGLSQDEFRNTPGVKSSIEMALKALERRSSAAGRLGAGLGQEEVDLVTDLTDRFYGQGWDRAANQFGINRDTYFQGANARYGSERSNRMDTQNILDSNRSFGLAERGQAFGEGQALWGRGNTESQQDRGFLFDAARLGSPANIAPGTAGYTGQANDYATDAAAASAAGTVGAGNAWSNALGAGIPIAQYYAMGRGRAA